MSSALAPALYSTNHQDSQSHSEHNYAQFTFLTNSIKVQTVLHIRTGLALSHAQTLFIDCIEDDLESYSSVEDPSLIRIFYDTRNAQNNLDLARDILMSTMNYPILLDSQFIHEKPQLISRVEIFVFNSSYADRWNMDMPDTDSDSDSDSDTDQGNIHRWLNPKGWLEELSSKLNSTHKIWDAQITLHVSASREWNYFEETYILEGGSNKKVEGEYVVWTRMPRMQEPFRLFVIGPDGLTLGPKRVLSLRILHLSPRLLDPFTVMEHKVSVSQALQAVNASLVKLEIPLYVIDTVISGGIADFLPNLRRLRITHDDEDVDTWAAFELTQPDVVNAKKYYRLLYDFKGPRNLHIEIPSFSHNISVESTSD